MVDLSDFRTKQVLHVPNLQTSHGGVFATPDTRYVHISSKVPALKGWDASKGQKITVKDHLDHYPDLYRGYSTFLRIDQKTGRMILKDSFQIELPPYTQDLADAGKGASYGYAFINSYNVEMATGGVEQGKPPLEVGASQLDFDYLHIVNWKKAEEVIAAGKFTELNGIRVISIETAIAEGLLFLAPEPRSPHGVDIAPRGDYITVSGKLDPHATVYGFDRIKKAIDEKNFEGKDRYGIPILKFDAVVAGKVELGAGPLHTQYDNKGNAYTSLYLESAVAKWTLGEPYHPADKAFKLVDKVSIHYNIGHLATAQGDTMDPQGKYLIAMNKWSIDRHSNVGPLHPQNFQLIDISGEKMELLADMPIGFGEPHYAQMIKADILKPHEVYEPGVSPASMVKSPDAIAGAKEARIVRRPGVVEVWMNVVRSHFTPDIIAGEGRRQGHRAPDQRRADAGRDARVRGADEERDGEPRPGRDDDGGVHRRQARLVQLLLHGVLLRPAPRDAGMADRRTEVTGSGRGRAAWRRVMRTRTLMVAAAAAAVLTTACGVKADGPPEIEVDRTSCAHCGMLISEPVYAAAYRTPRSESLGLRRHRVSAQSGSTGTAGRRAPLLVPRRRDRRLDRRHGRRVRHIARAPHPDGRRPGRLPRPRRRPGGRRPSAWQRRAVSRGIVRGKHAREGGL